MSSITRREVMVLIIVIGLGFVYLGFGLSLYEAGVSAVLWGILAALLVRD